MLWCDYPISLETNMVVTWQASKAFLWIVDSERKICIDCHEENLFGNGNDQTQTNRHRSTQKQICHRQYQYIEFYIFKLTQCDIRLSGIISLIFQLKVRRAIRWDSFVILILSCIRIYDKFIATTYNNILENSNVLLRFRSFRIRCIWFNELNKITSDDLTATGAYISCFCVPLTDK